MCSYVCNIITCTLIHVHAQGSHGGTCMKNMLCFANLKAWSHNSMRGSCFVTSRSAVSSASCWVQISVPQLCSSSTLCGEACHPTTLMALSCVSAGEHSAVTAQHYTRNQVPKASLQAYLTDKVQLEIGLEQRGCAPTQQGWWRFWVVRTA